MLRLETRSKHHTESVDFIFNDLVASEDERDFIQGRKKEALGLLVTLCQLPAIAHQSPENVALQLKVIAVSVESMCEKCT